MTGGGRPGIGRRLRSGLYAVPVASEELPRLSRYPAWWRLELACGCVLERHPTWTPGRAPRMAGCPQGHGAELAAVRDMAIAARADVEAAVEAVLRRWAERRTAAPGAEK